MKEVLLIGVMLRRLAMKSECELFGDFGVIIQIILGVASILSLLCKLKDFED
jgi:hypothetical protein